MLAGSLQSFCSSLFIAYVNFPATYINIIQHQQQQATGKTLESYVSEHQDRSRNALQKATEAAFLAWVEELRADQHQFMSEKVLYLDLLVWFLFLSKICFAVWYSKHVDFLKYKAGKGRRKSQGQIDPPTGGPCSVSKSKKKSTIYFVELECVL